MAIPPVKSSDTREPLDQPAETENPKVRRLRLALFELLRGDASSWISFVRDHPVYLRLVQDRMDGATHNQLSCEACEAPRVWNAVAGSLSLSFVQQLHTQAKENLTVVRSSDAREQLVRIPEPANLRASRLAVVLLKMIGGNARPWHAFLGDYPIYRQIVPNRCNEKGRIDYPDAETGEAPRVWAAATLAVTFVFLSALTTLADESAPRVNTRYHMRCWVVL